MGMVLYIAFFVLLSAIVTPALARKKPTQEFEKNGSRKRRLKAIREKLDTSGWEPAKKLSVLYIRRFPSAESSARSLTDALDLVQSDVLGDLSCNLFCLSDINYRLSETQEHNNLRRSAKIPALLMLVAGAILVVSSVMSSIVESSFWQMALLAIGGVSIAAILFFGLAAVVMSRQYSASFRDKKIQNSSRTPLNLADIQDQFDTDNDKAPRIFRSTDEDWQESVIFLANAVDVCVLEVSDVSEAIAWEIENVPKIVGEKKCLFAVSEESLGSFEKSTELQQALTAKLGSVPINLFRYDIPRNNEAVIELSFELIDHVHSVHAGLLNQTQLPAPAPVAETSEQTQSRRRLSRRRR